MTNDQKPSREWWIGISPIGVSHVCDTEKNAKAIGPKYTAVHVIEFSAYEAIKVEYDNLVLGRAGGHYIAEVIKEREELRKEVAGLSENLAISNKAAVELEQEVESLRKRINENTK